MSHYVHLKKSVIFHTLTKLVHVRWFQNLFMLDLFMLVVKSRELFPKNAKQLYDRVRNTRRQLMINL